MKETRPRPPLYSVPSTQLLRSARKVHVDDAELNQFIHTRTKNTHFSTYDYCAYYLPILSWLPQYNARESLLGDFLAGLSLASFQIPLVMSFATSLAHVPPVTGLYSIIGGACIYATFGSVPVLVVGALPATALIFGQAIDNTRLNPAFSHFSQLEVSLAISCVMAAMLLGCGLLRFGFLDSVLSRALLKGFMAAMGIIMIVNELAVETGLPKTNAHSVVQKFTYVVENIRKIDQLTCTISIVTLGVVLALRSVKIRLIPINKNAIYFPELLLMIATTTFLCYYYKWDVEVVGNATKRDGTLAIINPFQTNRIELYKNVFLVAFLCTILGYFDSTTATKALSAQHNYRVSSNKELIALGATNFALSLCSGLPAFGAFGRSKINMLAGATTPLAGIIMSVATGIAIVYILPALYYLPECVLALTTTIIGITVLQEIPSDLQFFVRIRGYDELLTFAVVFLATLFWSPTAGVSLGTLIAVVRVIRHSTRLRIQVLGRIPNTSVFRNADELIEELIEGGEEGGGGREGRLGNYGVNSEASSERRLVGDYGACGDRDTSDDDTRDTSSDSSLIAQIEGVEKVLIVKIPEALNFANVDDLKNKLARIERFGSLLIHPSQHIHRRDFTVVRAVIVDCKGMSAMDSLATQVLAEIVRKYTETGIIVCFSRVLLDPVLREKFSRAGITEMVNRSYAGSTLGISRMGDGFFLSIDAALRAVNV